LSSALWIGHTKDQTIARPRTKLSSDHVIFPASRTSFEAGHIDVKSELPRMSKALSPTESRHPARTIDTSKDSMALTGAGTVYLLIFLVIGSAVGTATFWNRLPGRPLVRWPGRVLMMIFCQLTACVLAAALVNDLGRFYTSWGELAGQHSRVTAQKPTAPPVANTIETELRKQNHRDGSAVVSIPIPIAGTKLQATAKVYLPAAYFADGFTTRQFPVVELIEGYPGSPDSWTHPLDVQKIADTEINSGRSVPFIAVMPDSNYLTPGHDGECLDVPNGAQVESTLVANVHAAVVANFRVPNSRHSWAIMGYSTGGYCALNIAMRHPDLFAAAVSQSGYTSPYQDGTTGPIFRDNPPSFRNDNDPLWLATNRPLPDIAVLFTTTKADPESWKQVTAFIAKSQAPMRVQSIFLDQGSHNFDTFRATEPAAFDWLSTQLPGPLAPPVTVDGRIPQSS
jgi:dienelactone hydrolase